MTNLDKLYVAWVYVNYTNNFDFYVFGCLENTRKTKNTLTIFFSFFKIEKLILFFNLFVDLAF